MARNTQIVPEKKYPFVETFYNDYSGWSDTPVVEPITRGFNSMCVFASSKGIDNKLVTKYSPSEFVEEFGNPNFKAYGQPALNAYKMLSTGNAIVHCMRVMPTDANYANTTIVAKVKIATKEAEIAPVAVPTNLIAVASTITENITNDEGEVTGTESTYEITVAWDKHAEATSYELCINNEVANLITVTTEEYVHSGLTAGNVYSYKVRAVGAEGTSAWSNVVELTAGAEGDEATVTAENIENTTQVPDKMIIKYEAISTDALRAESQIEVGLEEMAKAAEVDDEGYTTVPLFTIYSLGRGIYGNNYRLRVVDSLKMTEEYGMAVQQLELYEVETTFTIKERFYFTMDSTKVISGTSLFIGDVVGNPDEGSGKIGAFGNEDAFDTIFNMYTEAFPNADIAAEDFNIFTGLTSDTKSYVENLEIYTPTESETSISLSDVEGIPFAYGSDGSFAISNSNFSTALDNAYLSAFSKELDTGVVSKRRFPVEVLLDAGYSLETKVQMAALGLERGDCQTIIDAGYLSTRYEAINWADSVSIASIEDWSISKVFQHAVVKDPFTGKSIKVTATYFYAGLLPTHYFVNGRHNAMVGQDYGLCEGIINEKIYPMVEYDDDEMKTALVERHLNWIEAIATNTFVIGVQNTSQMANSDMIEMSNAAVLLAMKRDLDSLCLSFTYKFGEASDRERYTKDAITVLDSYKDMVRSFEVYFDMNTWEEQRSILHCYLSVTFKTIVKNVIVEIDINSRVSSDVTTSAN